VKPDPVKPDPVKTKIFRVVSGPVNWRTSPTLEPRALIRGKYWRTGQTVEVDADSRTEAEGYVWWQHSEGWSAERSLTTTIVFMVEENQVVGASDLFSRLSMDLNVIQWVQYYGNTTFAYENGKANAYDSYSQGLHGGIDLGGASGKAVYCGIRADLNPVCTYVGNQRAFGPNRVDITVGEYLVIYGHLATPDFGLLGKSVTPDTVLGYIDSTQRHVHIEIRKGGKILNPLNFMPESLRATFIGRYSPSGVFQPNGGVWETPLGQPDIEIGKGLIGPRAAG
jgi:murein DD-endopeptidase MepM/ murein hydrolase activator NlpD